MRRIKKIYVRRPEDYMNLSMNVRVPSSVGGRNLFPFLGISAGHHRTTDDFVPTNLMGLIPCLNNLIFGIEIFKHIYAPLYTNYDDYDVLSCFNL